MRLTLRLLVLALLLCVASFTSMVSRVSKADESACTDGCGNGVWRCRANCPVPGTCEAQCATEFDKCMAKCGRPATEEGGS